MPPTKKASPPTRAARSKKPAKRTTARAMSADHKEALAQGREQARAVRRYLEALEQNRSKRGRPLTTESIDRRLKEIETQLADASALQRLQLLQRRRDLTDQRSRASDDGPDLATLEAEFVNHARSYGNAKGITYATWREAGVAAAVLKRAGVRRGGR